MTEILLWVAALGGALYLGILAIGLMLFGLAWFLRRRQAQRTEPFASCVAALEQRDASGEIHDVTAELGAARPVPGWYWRMRPNGLRYVHRAWPSWTTPLEFLPDDEWRCWTEIIAERGVRDG